MTESCVQWILILFWRRKIPFKGNEKNQAILYDIKTNISGNFSHREFIFLAMNPGNLPESAQIWLKSLLPLCYGGFVAVLRDSCPRPAHKAHDSSGGVRWLLGSVLMLAGKVSQQLLEGRYLGWSSTPQTATILFSLPTQNTTLTPGLLHTVKFRRPWRRSEFIRASPESGERLTHKVSS